MLCRFVGPLEHGLKAPKEAVPFARHERPCDTIGSRSTNECRAAILSRPRRHRPSIPFDRYPRRLASELPAREHRGAARFADRRTRCTPVQVDSVVHPRAERFFANWRSKPTPLRPKKKLAAITLVLGAGLQRREIGTRTGFGVAWHHRISPRAILGDALASVLRKRI